MKADGHLWNTASDGPLMTRMPADGHLQDGRLCDVVAPRQRDQLTMSDGESEEARDAVEDSDSDAPVMGRRNADGHL